MSITERYQSSWLWMVHSRLLGCAVLCPCVSSCPSVLQPWSCPGSVMHKLWGGMYQGHPSGLLMVCMPCVRQTGPAAPFKVSQHLLYDLRVPVPQAASLTLTTVALGPLANPHQGCVQGWGAVSTSRGVSVGRCAVQCLPYKIPIIHCMLRRNTCS